MERRTRLPAQRASGTILGRGLATALLALSATDASAHHAEWMTGRPFVQGLAMPLHGIDHILVAVAVGLVAARLGGGALWGVPGVFAVFMLVAGILNVNGVAVPGVELAILASILVLGVVLARERPLPPALGIVLVALLAGVQGSALIASPASPEPGWSLARFAAGCIAAALAVVASGVGLGLGLERLRRREVVRYAGVTIMAAGVLVYVFPAANDVMIRLLEGAP